MVAGGPSASFSLSSPSLVFMACGIMTMTNYPESVAHGSGSESSGPTGPSLSHAQTHIHAEILTHICTHKPEN